MKKLCLVLSMLALVSAPTWAAFQAGPVAASTDGKGVSFGGQVSLGVVNGEAKEHVYDYETADGSRRQLSRLDWDLKNVVMGGGNGSVRLLKKLTLNGGVWFALTEGNDGEMEDYDWLDMTSSEWTHYSLSEVDVTQGYIVDVNAAWDLVTWNDLTARIYAGYKQNGWTWEDRVQFGIYDFIYWEGNGDNMINYEQEFRIPYVGGSADWAVGNFTFTGYVTWSPFVSATDWDEHVARDMHYKETFDGGDLLGLGAEARYSFSQGSMKGAFVSAAVDYQKIDLIVGDVEFYGEETGYTVVSDTDMAGVENNYLMISVGGGFQF